MLEGIIRESISKSFTKALRNDGYLIANIYGTEINNIHCAFKLNEFMKFIKTKENLIFQVKVGEKILDVVVQEYQRNPINAELIHVDLLSIRKDSPMKFKIPVLLEGNAVGLKNKGVLFFSKKRIKVQCKSENVINFIKLDVSALDVGDSILVRDLPKFENIKIMESPNIPIVGVIKAK